MREAIATARPGKNRPASQTRLCPYRRWGCVKPQLKQLEAVVVVVPEVVLEAGVEEGDRRLGARRQRLIRGAERDEEQVGCNVLELCWGLIRPLESERGAEGAEDLLGN